MDDRVKVIPAGGRKDGIELPHLGRVGIQGSLGQGSLTQVHETSIEAMILLLQVQ